MLRVLPRWLRASQRRTSSRLATAKPSAVDIIGLSAVEQLVSAFQETSNGLLSGHKEPSLSHAIPELFNSVACHELERAMSEAIAGPAESDALTPLRSLNQSL